MQARTLAEQQQTRAIAALLNVEVARRGEATQRRRSHQQAHQPLMAGSQQASFAEISALGHDVLAKASREEEAPRLSSPGSPNQNPG